jgi:menaquinone-dependent protoporphyrinogen IX oxidase
LIEWASPDPLSGVGRGLDEDIESNLASVVVHEIGCCDVSEPQPQSSTSKPRVLIVYYTYTQQSARVAEVMAEVLRDRGCEVRQASIGFTDKRWADRFTRFPLKHAWLDVLGMLPAQIRGATGEIVIPDEVTEGDYDLVCIGSPTWFFKPSVPIRSFLKSDEVARLLDGKRFTIFVVCRRYWSINLKSVRKHATKLGGQYVDGIHFAFAGSQIPSFLSLISYFGKGEDRERYLGVKLPPSMLKPDFSEQARAFADGLADELSGAGELPKP